ncbi:MAG: CvpA family protein [Clostridia bacterium]|nr:CvpA family protein [Clostridia bacterium]
MNLLDIAILAVLFFFMLSGFYKGFLSTALSTGAYIVSWLISIIFLPLAANGIKLNADLYNMMLYYTEGSEFINDIELSRAPISSISSSQLSEIITQSDLPYPMGKEIPSNIANEVFADQGITTLGDYFNQTIVCVFINILVFLFMFVIIRCILALIINGVDYAWVFPKLQKGDALLGGCVGLIRGMLAVFLLFMLLPIMLTVLGDFEIIRDFIDGSFFTPFFYRSNFLLSLIPGV